MNRLVLNGSPRGLQSNSRLIISWMVEGMEQAGAEPPEILDLVKTRDVAAQRQAFLEADETVLVFPLYTDSTPGIVKNFIDSLEDVPAGALTGKRLAIVVHSGFPEALHSEAVAAFMERLCRRLGMVHAGTAIRGGSEGFRLMPPKMTAKNHALFQILGKSLVETGSFDEEAVRRLGRPRRIGMFALFGMAFLKAIHVLDLYWIIMLKQHGAWKRRFDQPYAWALSTPDAPMFEPDS